ncbi:MAG: hypothetical protein AB7N65_17390 [Vicinamibacterales bacterium]
MADARNDMMATAIATTPLAPASLGVPGWFPRAAAAIGELLAAVGIVLCIPFVILAIGVPIALLVRFLLWIGGVL